MRGGKKRDRIEARELTSHLPPPPNPRLEAIKSSREMPLNPILNPGDGEGFHNSSPPPRSDYNPVLQRFPDEVDTGKDIMNEMDDYDRRMEKMRLAIEHEEINKQMQPHPPEEHSRQSKEYFKAR